MEVANGLAQAPPLALRRIKANLNDADRLMNFSTALDGEAERHARSGFHPDAAEAGKDSTEAKANFPRNRHVTRLGNEQIVKTRVSSKT